ncbi:response regulator [Oligoflexus tunisiensis]|uniref:response regulator n=1 Tax=Oligoflexus tunisiensis TaxID=708132 RepID=UPI00114C9F97|nr:response regulator [Oligoflexus tunisiensis]
MQARILLVDDEEGIRSIIRDDLRDLGWDVIESQSADEAIELLGSTTVDVVLTDIRMPKVTGFHLLKNIRSKFGTEPPVVLMSAHTDVQFWDAYDAGADGYFGKPFRLSDLQNLLEHKKTPMEQKWSESFLDPNAAHVAHHFQLSDEGKANPVMSLGRGGMFLKTDAPQIRRGHKVSFEIQMSGMQLKGMGVVLWRRLQDEKDLSAGFGIEFLYLDPSCRMDIIRTIAASKSLPYIPKGTMEKS